MTEENNDNNTKSNTRSKLVSRLKYPIRLKLKDGESIFIAPHGTIESIDTALIESSLPTGIHTVEFKV